ncbi:hypothetical protein CkP1_0288 [Citrobacter phage CkP1]|nr:hypothetical protein CkP1_0288 [Citrobacter phage CkP1]
MTDFVLNVIASCLKVITIIGAVVAGNVVYWNYVVPIIG